MKLLLFLFALTITGGIDPNPEPSDAEDIVRDMAMNWLEANYPGVRFSVEVKWISGKLSENASEEDIQQLLFSDQELPRGLVQAKIKTHSDGMVPVQIYVKPVMQVIVVNETINRGHKISRNSTSIEWRDVTQLRELPLLEFNDAEWIAKRRVEKGSVIYPNEIDYAAIIEYGDHVVMRYHQAGLVLKMICKSRKKGAKGETITVKCDDTGQRYKVEILDNNRVQWRQTL